MAYQVFLASYLSGKRDHQAIFVETEVKGDGYLFHVVGSIQRGMTYEAKPAQDPSKSPSFVRKELLGTVSRSDYLSIDLICRNKPPPAKQFNGTHRIDRTVPLQTCQEWARDTIQDLKIAGILQ